VRTAGWTVGSGIRFGEALALADGRRVLVTAIDRDGTLAGPDVDLVRQAVDAGGRVLAAGGIRSVADVVALANAGAEAAIVGRALLVSDTSTGA
jgi:phosphoribosylformimino-5-aminoimidazole carboxamide ribonucleotide (ProFAR) isomerase